MHISWIKIASGPPEFDAITEGERVQSQRASIETTNVNALHVSGEKPPSADGTVAERLHIIIVTYILVRSWGESRLFESGPCRLFTFFLPDMCIGGGLVSDKGWPNEVR
jgi:hypothetical protein